MYKVHSTDSVANSPIYIYLAIFGFLRYNANFPPPAFQLFSLVLGYASAGFAARDLLHRSQLAEADDADMMVGADTMHPVWQQRPRYAAQEEQQDPEDRAGC